MIYPNTKKRLRVRVIPAGLVRQAHHLILSEVEGLSEGFRTGFVEDFSHTPGCSFNSSVSITRIKWLCVSRSVAKEKMFSSRLIETPLPPALIPYEAAGDVMEKGYLRFESGFTLLGVIPSMKRASHC